jgi:hypothetical protein
VAFSLSNVRFQRQSRAGPKQPNRSTLTPLLEVDAGDELVFGPLSICHLDRQLLLSEQEVHGPGNEGDEAGERSRS